MIIDKENLFFYQKAITVTAASDVIDLGPNHWAKASGSDREIPCFLHIAEDFTADGAATLKVELQSSNAEAFGSGVITHGTWNFGKADLAQGKRMPLNAGVPADVLRYVRLNLTVGTGPMTAGKLTAGIVAGRQTNI